MSILTEQEALYLAAKKAYYDGSPIMLDKEFDDLELDLQQQGSNVINIVGSDVKTRKKFKHVSRMLSLGKIKSLDDVVLPVKEFEKWESTINRKVFELTPKYDGNAVNLIYVNGVLDRAITRGNGDVGQDVTKKLIVPKKIETTVPVVEIRGEVVIEIAKFNEKYSEFKNPRNFVAGVLNQKEGAVNPDIDFIPFEIKYHADDIITYEEHVESQLLDFGFKKTPVLHVVENITAKKFDEWYHTFLNLRDGYKYQLDGFVIKAYHNDDRIRLGDNGHHPEWAIAVKFSPKNTPTEIIDIEWNIGKTGEFTPVGLLRPVDLDGSMVSRVSLCNISYMNENKVFPGATISLVKSGDIIPMVANVIEQSSNKYEFPSVCPHCGDKLTIVDGIHLMCLNVDCDGRNAKKFKYGIEQLSIDFFGDKIVEKIYYYGKKSNIMDVFDVLNAKKFNKLFLMKFLPDGKTITNLLSQIATVKELSVATIIKMMGIDSLGKQTAEQIGLMLAGKKYSTFGLQKSHFDMFQNGSEMYNNFWNIHNKLELCGIKVKFPEEVSDDVQFYECTGSPTPHFKTKKDFEVFADSEGFAHSSLTKNCRYLITDAYDSTSSKMVKAKKLGVEIISYSDFLTKYMGA